MHPCAHLHVALAVVHASLQTGSDAQVLCRPAYLLLHWRNILDCQTTAWKQQPKPDSGAHHAGCHVLSCRRWSCMALACAPHLAAMDWCISQDHPALQPTCPKVINKQGTAQVGGVCAHYWLLTQRCQQQQLVAVAVIGAPQARKHDLTTTKQAPRRDMHAGLR